MNTGLRNLGMAVVTASALFASAIPGTAQIRPLQQHMSRLYATVDNPGSIVGFDPSVAIAGALTKIKIPFGIALDRRHNEILVANRGAYHGRSHGSIVRLAAGRGNIAPKSVIACNGFNPWAVTLDPRGNVVTGDLATNQVLTFAHDADGCPMPLSSLGGPHTGIKSPIGLAFDSRRQLVVLNFNAGIDVFAPGASGDATPAAVISGGELAGCEGVALDHSDNIYAVNYSSGELYEFAAGSQGNAAPMRSIAGPHTMLRSPIAVAVDRDGTIYVADYGNSAILVFSARANGDATPVQVLRAGQPTALAVLR